MKHIVDTIFANAGACKKPSESQIAHDLLHYGLLSGIAIAVESLNWAHNKDLGTNRGGWAAFGKSSADIAFNHVAPVEGSHDRWFHLEVRPDGFRIVTLGDVQRNREGTEEPVFEYKANSLGVGFSTYNLNGTPVRFEGIGINPAKVLELVGQWISRNAPGAAFKAHEFADHAIRTKLSANTLHGAQWRSPFEGQRLTAC